ncbi:uncharacterized protein Tco025E_03125 [Trypanosoma conorhini]|uniref:Uncharacterized protein n=1 Tax=Trypanosoma conorhini TaxID=83891 RepID=A0A422PXI6_9TRYP|nr:uncharacterized protein Tco025E_03125 [Trypanosoma conorhini]RNF22453.1 hypothetical protein Tco025E_03125 [Trypanosoma conorhini]
MQNDLAQILQSIDWESIREESETTSAGATSVPAALPSDASLPHAESGVSGHVEGARDGSSMAATSIPVPQQQQQQQQQQQMPTLQMGPAGGAYYVNAPSYQAIGMPAPQGRGQVQTQPMMFAQPGGQVMYMQMPYFQHAAYQHNISPQQLYSTPQNPYYHPHFVQLPVEGQMLPQMPQLPQQQQQQQQQYCPPSALPTRGMSTAAFQQQKQQPDFVDNQGGFVCLLPGTQLPQGAPLYYYGVRPTRQYLATQQQENFFDPPGYNTAFWQANSQFTDRTENSARREGKGKSSRVPSCTLCGQSNFTSESALRSHVRTKHGDNGSPPATLQSTESAVNVTPAAAPDDKDLPG